MANKLKVGDIVEIRSRTIRHFIKNLALYYLKPQSFDFETHHMEEILVWISAFLKKASSPKGKVVAFGARVDGEHENYIIVTVRNQMGKIEKMPLLERDVIKSKK